jgi:hypothetical protein
MLRRARAIFQARTRRGRNKSVAEPARSAARKHTEIDNQRACYIPAIASAGLEAPSLVRQERIPKSKETECKKKIPDPTGFQQES